MLEAGELRLRRMKNADQDVVFLPPRTAMLLRTYVGARTSGALFPAAHGEGMTTRSVGRRLEAWVQRAGVDGQLSPHGLRHTFASGLYHRTRDVLLVRRALNHKSIASTTVYARASDAAVRHRVGIGDRAVDRGVTCGDGRAGWPGRGRHRGNGHVPGAGLLVNRSVLARTAPGLGIAWAARARDLIRT